MSIFVGRKTPATRLRTWQHQAPRYAAHLNQVQADAAQDYFESLRVHTDDAHRTVQLLSGSHVSGSLDANDTFEVEGGAALVVSQDQQFGHVAIFLYPYERQASAASTRILWALFDSPEDVTNEWLDRAVSDFARVCRASSVVDETTDHSDRRRFFWLRCRSLWLRLVGRFPWWFPLVRSRPSLSRKAWLWIGGIVIGLGVILNVPSELATLFGVTVPQLWTAYRHAGKAASAPLGASAVARPPSDMPVITGWYTFCPQDRTGASPRLLDLLYDIRQNAGKVAFFDVQVDVDCVMGTPFDPDAAFSRRAGEHSLTYSFGPGHAEQGEIDGGRPPIKPGQLVAENGTFVTILDDRDGRNALTRLGINAEGADDQLYGPYLIKADGEDAALTLKLSAPTLDSTMQDAATAIAAQRRAAHENDPSPNGVPQRIKLSAADLQRLQALATSPTASTASGVRPPTALPPLDAGSLGRLPKLPPVPPVPRPASRTAVQAGSH